jgi:CDP-diacylglycerol--glycerol-3-phosphate 3-phosphatidyltransferase
MINIPNLLSSFRLLSAPILLVLAWFKYEYAFLILLVLALLSDGIDGYIARRFNLITELGAKLDTWGDASIYLTLGISAFWLWPDAVYAELQYFVAMFASVIFPTVVSLVKFNVITSYHTWLIKIAALTAVTSVLLLFMDIANWPFRIAAIITVLAALEEVAITALIDQPKTNVRSIWHVMHDPRFRS